VRAIGKKKMFYARVRGVETKGNAGSLPASRSTNEKKGIGTTSSSEATPKESSGGRGYKLDPKIEVEGRPGSSGGWPGRGLKKRDTIPRD